MREVVAILLWLSTLMRPGITNTLRAVARYAHTSTERVWQAIMKTSSYLNETKRFRVIYVRGPGQELEVYADADYADKASDKRSVSGIAATLV